ncbi:hypothetical protein D3C87_301540 [compost metagenome]
MKMAILVLSLFIAGCGLDASLTDLSVLDPIPPIEKTQRTETDFVAGEIVTTGNGVVFKGTFGELSEKKALANGVVFEGAFYE